MLKLYLTSIDDYSDLTAVSACFIHHDKCVHIYLMKILFLQQNEAVIRCKGKGCVDELITEPMY